MKGGVLEVLVVGAEGFGHTGLFGNTGYYVVIRCGKVTCKSRIKSGKGKRALWNEKFIFEFPFSEWQNSSHLNVRIMDKHIITEDDFLGETIIHLGGILAERSQNGWLELKPGPYNIVAEDGTYNGTIKIGLKYIDSVEVKEVETKETCEAEKLPRSLYKGICNFMRAPLFRFYFHLRHANPSATQKHGQ